MAQMGSELPHDHEDHPAVISHNARVGLALFLVYFALYVGFLLLNIFAPRAMADTALPLGGDHVLFLGGSNLAVAYGIMLILAAILLSLAYMRLTKSPGKKG